ncbi:hypothetical protein J6590_066803 [Homalodisca vitripennis]|nr:hypothetical protein J6590_066803 [Homalodisca vitripennis]
MQLKKSFEEHEDDKHVSIVNKRSEFGQLFCNSFIHAHFLLGLILDGLRDHRSSSSCLDHHRACDWQEQWKQTVFLEYTYAVNLQYLLFMIVTASHTVHLVELKHDLYDET